jgi:hypothetical protein
MNQQNEGENASELFTFTDNSIFLLFIIILMINVAPGRCIIIVMNIRYLTGKVNVLQISLAIKKYGTDTNLACGLYAVTIVYPII